MEVKKASSFQRRLTELNQWQIQQSSKLEEFRETQNKLFYADYNILKNDNSLHKDNTKNVSMHTDGLNKENTYKAYQALNPNKPIKCNPEIYGFDILFDSKSNCQNQAKDERNIEENHFISKLQEQCVKPFLKRGQGLARFRMTSQDFRSLPKIYKNKHIKTYLNRKPDFIKKDLSSKNINSEISVDVEREKKKFKTQKRKPSISVNIYVPENRLKENNLIFRIPEEKNGKRGIKKVNDDFAKKTSTTVMNPAAVEKNEKKSFATAKGILPSETYDDAHTEKKHEDNELEIFELIEKKINEDSFCSSSSLVNKLFEQHGISKILDMQGTHSETCHYERADSNTETRNFPVEKKKGKSESVYPDLGAVKCLGYESNGSEENKENEELPVEGSHSKAEKFLEEKQSSHKGGLPTKCVMAENSNLKVAECDLKVSEKEMPKIIKTFSKSRISSFENVSQNNHINQKEMAMKLQRKGLQDNVKQLMNWEISPRKKIQKRIVKKNAKVKSRKTEKKSCGFKESSETVSFDSTLLRQRLEELEKEIAIFRKESSKIEKLRKECNEEKIKLFKEKKELEKKVQEEREKLEEKVAEDRKRLQRERNIFEIYCKQAVNRPTKQERQELDLLKKQIEKMTETASAKEVKWAASQARLRNQIKSLEKDNAQLTAELDKLRKFSVKKDSFESEKKFNAKIMRIVNSELEKLKPIKMDLISDRCCCKMSEQPNAKQNRILEEKPLRRIKSAPNIKKKLLFERIEDTSNVLVPFSTHCNSERGEKKPHYEEGEKTNERNSRRDTVERLLHYRGINDLTRENRVCDEDGDYVEGADGKNIKEAPKTREIENEGGNAVKNMHENQCSEGLNYSVDSGVCRESRSFDLSAAEEKENTSLPSFINDSQSKCDKRFRCDSFSPDHPWMHENYCCPKLDVFPKCKYIEEDRAISSEDSLKRATSREGGIREIVYPNGNIKKIFPGNKVVRIIYYNGDIKETNSEEGSEKYYYSETQTWHTTYQNGMEVLEFPTGQTERRYADGSSEIAFPNGCIRYSDSSGRDEWRFSDGTVMKMEENGQKILFFTNGQKEVQTKEFKQREYPDGTIKILYANGCLETRYSSGRVRMKDQDGNLVMDSGGIC